MAGGPGKLRKTTKPDGDYVWNGFGTIVASVVYLEAPDRWSARKSWSKERTNMRGWQGTRKMMMYEDDEHSLEFTLDWSIRMERFP